MVPDLFLIEPRLLVHGIVLFQTIQVPLAEMTDKLCLMRLSLFRRRTHQ